MSAPVSIKEVAARAGVSVGTVSNVLNRPEIVAVPTRDRVQAAIKALGFVRNEPARQLQARGTAVILVDARSASSLLCSVSVDDVLGGDLAVTHLLEGGHQRIAFVGGPAGLHQVADRREGGARALRRAGHDPDRIVSVIETAALNVAAGQTA